MLRTVLEAFMVNILKKMALSATLAIVVLMTASCGGFLGGSGGTATALWSDVPPMEGATLNRDLQLPVVARVALQAASQGNFEFVAYVTDKSPQDVANFYTNERMSAQGWTAENGGCTSLSGDSGTTAGGGFCLFSRKDDNRDTALFIFAARDEQQAQTQLFYVRASAATTPSP
jgi:hypothetical protein